MKQRSKFWPALIVLIFSTFLVTACGGGGGGGGTEQITYDGVSTQATITGENAAELAELAYTGSELGDQSMIFSAVETGDEESTDAASPLIPKLTDIFQGLPDQLASGISEPSYERTVTTISESGSCTGGGSVSISGAFDDVNGTLDATITFNSCTENSESMNGSMNISASGLATDAYGDPVFDTVNMDITFNTLTYSSAAANITVAGDTTMTIAGDSASMTMSMVMRDNNTGLSGKVENYAVSIVDMLDHSEFTISGKVYRSDLGYVELSTPTPVLVDNTYGEPYEGVYQIEGAGGTWAKVDFSQMEGTYRDATGTLGEFSI